MSRPRVLIAEDDAPLRQLLRLIGDRCACDVEAVPNGQIALERLAVQDYDVIVVDLMMPVVNGFDLLEQLRDLRRRPFVIVVTAMDAPRNLPLDPSIVAAVIHKPFDIEFLASLLGDVGNEMAKRRMNREATAPVRERDAHVIEFRAGPGDPSLRPG